jgi:phytoene synthase
MKDRVLEHSKEMIRLGSKSFAGAARILPTATRRSVYMLYAWCRYCDDQIDEQDLGRDAPSRFSGSADVLAQLKSQTQRALDGEHVGEPAFAALQRVVARHDIPARHPLELLRGFEMDVEGRSFVTLEDTLDYCYHVAGVVGVMMALVMDAREQEALDRAADLGIALQMTNIARDVIDDAHAGRVYLPLEWLDEANVPVDEVADPRHREAVFGVAKRLIESSELYYSSAVHGLSWLEPRCAWAIATARGVYREIGRTLLRRGVEAWDSRTYVGRPQKAARALMAGVEAALAVGRRRRRTVSPDSRKGLRERP